MHTYTNPWHKPHQPMYGPATYQTDAGPIEYRGHLIFRRLPAVFDVVKDGKCLAQRAGLNGAKAVIDALVGDRKGSNHER